MNARFAQRSGPSARTSVCVESECAGGKFFAQRVGAEMPRRAIRETRSFKRIAGNGGEIEYFRVPHSCIWAAAARKRSDTDRTSRIPVPAGCSQAALAPAPRALTPAAHQGAPGGRKPRAAAGAGRRGARPAPEGEDVFARLGYFSSGWLRGRSCGALWEGDSAAAGSGLGGG